MWACRPLEVRPGIGRIRSLAAGTASMREAELRIGLPGRDLRVGLATRRPG